MNEWNWLTITNGMGTIEWDGEFYPQWLKGGDGEHIGTAILGEMHDDEWAALQRGESVTVGGGAAPEYTLTPGMVRG